MVLLHVADSEYPDQAARMRTPTWVFTVNYAWRHVCAWRGPYTHSGQRHHWLPTQKSFHWTEICKESFMRRMICKKGFVLFLFSQRYFGYLLVSCSIYTCTVLVSFLINCHLLSDSQIFILTSFVVVSSVGIKNIYCTFYLLSIWRNKSCVY